jgi:Xaa-Pro dipeptidase
MMASLGRWPVQPPKTSTARAARRTRERYAPAVMGSEPTAEAKLDTLYLDHVADLELRVARVLAAEGWDAVVLESGAPAKRSRFDDAYWPLRSCPHFQHWTSLAEAECAIVVRPGRRAALLRPAATSFWEKPAAPDTRAFERAFDVVRYSGAYDAEVRERAGGGRVAFVGEGREGGGPEGLVKALDALRTTKTPYEVACIAEANGRAQAGHDALRDAFRAGDASELDLHLLFLKATRQDDWETPYKNIVALGENAATLHHVAYGRQARGRAAESLLVDAAATCRGYCGDVTRTWVKGTGAAASAFAQLVAGVEAMQQRLCAAVRVGMRYEALHDESHRQVAAVLREVGLVKGAAEEAVARGVTRAFYPHGLGHSLGLQTHDVGCGLRAPRADNPFLRNTSDVAVGQVFTIEPGVYVIDALLAPLRAKPEGGLVDWAMVDALAPLGGVRIEDDVFVHAEGLRNLTRERMPAGGGLLD